LAEALADHLHVLAVAQEDRRVATDGNGACR